MVSLELEARLNNLLSSGQAETADNDLFAPLTEREECPICLIPLPIEEDEIVFMHCCGKNICIGCAHTQLLNDKKNGVPKHKISCAFCRQAAKNTNLIKATKKLMKKNNIQAFMSMAVKYKSGSDGLFQSDTRALEMYIRAAELGHADAYALVGDSYQNGKGLVEVNLSKALGFYEVSAKKGSVYAHRKLAQVHWRKTKNIQMSIRHYKVAARSGCQIEMDWLMKCYKRKLLSKEELTQTLRAFQASTAELKSKDREDVRAMGW